MCAMSTAYSSFPTHSIFKHFFLPPVSRQLVQLGWPSVRVPPTDCCTLEYSANVNKVERDGHMTGGMTTDFSIKRSRWIQSHVVYRCWCVQSYETNMGKSGSIWALLFIVPCVLAGWSTILYNFTTELFVVNIVI